MSLIEYCAYLKIELVMLRSEVKKLQASLAEATAQQNLYEPLLQEPENAPEKPDPPISYWQWLRYRKG